MGRKYTKEEIELITAAMIMAGYHPGGCESPRSVAHRNLQKSVKAFKAQVKRQPDYVSGMHAKFWVNKNTEWERK